MFAFLLIALFATLAIAIVGWFRPVPAKQPAAPTPQTYSSQQVADAKTSICAAYQKVRKAGDLAGARKIDYLADAPDSETEPLIRAGTDAHTTTEGLCK